ncbi:MULTISPECIES: hypothetical protein [Methylomonas]|uniref:Uncharacterized protein n=1 Tax=Methylomonas denitrificans TaxID=1538553 RepID=A0A126T4D1_9GAMM|nr:MULTISPECIES: hypothetical protein [Methylomonas]AMK76928.1 hypothetical protein JT25_010585 [Methylomonas denitrificans]
MSLNIYLYEVHMIYLEWGFVLIKVLLGLWIISFLIRPFVSYEIQEFFRNMDEFIVEQISSIPIWLSNLWLFAGTILYFIGNFTVLLLLTLGVFMLGYSIFLHAQEVDCSLESVYNLAKSLVEEKTAWSGATTIVASTVAIGHMWKLNLDKRQYFEKREKELHEKYEARRNKERERSKSQSGFV